MTNPNSITKPRRRCWQCGRIRKAVGWPPAVLFCIGCFQFTLHGPTHFTPTQANATLNRTTFTHSDRKLEIRRRRAVGYTARCMNTCHIWEDEETR